ncbi:hypothetical protein D9M72_474840 [compost metagenome]
MQRAATEVTAAWTVPLAPESAHSRPAGCECTVTSYVAPSGTACANAKLPSAVRLNASAPLLCSTSVPPARPESVPPTVCVRAAQATRTSVMGAEAVPWPALTAQVWPCGCWAMLTA